MSYFSRLRWSPLAPFAPGELTDRISDQRHRKRDERDAYECAARERHHESDHLDGSLARLTCQDSSGSFWRLRDHSGSRLRDEHLPGEVGQGGNCLLAQLGADECQLRRDGLKKRGTHVVFIGMGERAV
jgi:hypothetical protein